MNPLDELNAATVTRFHSALLENLKQGGEAPVIPSTALWQAIEDNHRCNIALWDEEDQARRRDVPDSAIANSKRLIDGHNQHRNDASNVSTNWSWPHCRTCRIRRGCIRKPSVH